MLASVETTMGDSEVYRQVETFLLKYKTPTRQAILVALWQQNLNSNFDCSVKKDTRSRLEILTSQLLCKALANYQK